MCGLTWALLGLGRFGLRRQTCCAMGRSGLRGSSASHQQRRQLRAHRRKEVGVFDVLLVRQLSLAWYGRRLREPLLVSICQVPHLRDVSE